MHSSAFVAETSMSRGGSITHGMLKFHVFDAPEYNTFDRDSAMRYVDLGHRLLREVEVEHFRLRNCLIAMSPKASTLTS